MADGNALPRDHLDWIFKLARRTVRHLWLALLITAVGAVATQYVVGKRELSYMSQAVVFYQEGVNLNLGNEGPSARKMGQRLKETVLARAKITQLIEELDLEPRLRSAGRMTDAVDEVRKGVGFKVNDGDTYILSFTGPTPQVAQKVTTRLTELLIEENARMRAQQAEVSRGFLDAERKRNEENLRVKETEVARFLAKHPEFASELASPQSSGAAVRLAARPAKPADENDEGDTVLRALRREEERIRQQLLHPGEVPVRERDPVLAAAAKEAEARLASARRELADRKTRFTDEHPDVRAAAAVVKQAEEAYKRAVEAVKTGDTRPADEVMEIEPKAALMARLTQVQDQIKAHLRRGRGGPTDTPAVDTTNDAAQRIVATETDWARLKRELNEAKDRFEALDSRQFAATITATSLAEGRTAQIEVIDPAYLPSKSTGTTKKRMLLMGIAAAFMLGLGAALGLAIFDDRVFDARDVERLGIAPVLIAVPHAVSRSRFRPKASGKPSGQASRG